MQRITATGRATATATAMVAVGLIAAACGLDSAATVLVTRDTLANGAERLRYGALAPPAVEPVDADLSIGKIEGEAHEIFGDVRSVEADADGNIYVLDAQSAEIRVYDPAGTYLRTLTRKGGGPSELTATNGMVLRDSMLWVEDHGQWKMIALRLDGTEVARHPMPVLSYGWVYDGTVDDGGRLWATASHSDGEEVFPPPEGVNEGTSRIYGKWLDPATGAVDSIYLGSVPYRTLVTHTDRGYSVRGIPFTTRENTVLDPTGGFWRLSADSYRFVHLTPSGDTAVVVEADVAAIPVTAEDRDAYLEAAVERRPTDRRAAEEVLALAPATKPILDLLFLDDEGNVWVRRVVPSGQPPLFDVFTRRGDYLGSLTLAFTPDPYIPPRVRNGALYALVRDSLDVPTVVRAPLPPLDR